MNNPHELNNEEKRLSRYASEQLGFKVMVFRDGNWICQPYDLRYNLGFGTTPDKAIASCKENTMENKPIEYPADMKFDLPNCGIVAMTICAGSSLDEATEWFRTCRRRNGNWRGSTHHSDYSKWLRHKGVWFRQVDYDSRERVRTIGDFAQWAATPGVLYAIRCAGHMMTCKDGWIADQHHIVEVSKHWKRNARLKNHWEIIQ